MIPGQEKEASRMARIPRMVVTGEPAVYHVISRTALDGFVLGDVEKESLLDLIKRLSSVYFAEVLGFCIMGTHFHLLVRMHPGDGFSDEEMGKRFSTYYGPGHERQLNEERIDFLRQKWGSLSEYVREIKQTFSRYYNKTHGRRGFFWGERFKSVIVDNGDTLVNCLAYIDLNPVRAGICKVPEDYRWCSLGYHVQSGNKDGFLSLDFGLRAFGVQNAIQRLHYYRKFVYEKGSISPGKGAVIDSEILDREKVKGFAVGIRDRFRYRTRYFTDSGIIGTKEFVARCYQKFRDYFSSRREKRPRAVAGLAGIYSLKRLSE
jgi:putative transposase